MKTIIQIQKGFSVTITREEDNLIVETKPTIEQSIQEAEISKRNFEKRLNFINNYGSNYPQSKSMRSGYSTHDRLQQSLKDFNLNNFCKIGSLFKRVEYPDNIYAVFKHDGMVKILNVTLNTFWNNTHSLQLSKLKDELGEYLTISEFMKLVGKKDISNFTLIKL